MSRGIELTDFEKGKIVCLKENGVSMKEISRQIKRSFCVVQTFLKSPSGYGTTKRYGRKRHLIGQIEKQIVRDASNSTVAPAHLRCLADVNVSRSTSTI
ncbi:unnamed protein product [Hermetia illucens]|uniref:Tc3 transposase DNA binding domain-containing protein n=1 Tax=Hermetia illucens TaxID=343691 RepID=A0A7R8UZP7_HERIL|nr:unnamed protein product [Hermetia illucens]